MNSPHGMLLAMQHREALRDRNKERKEKRRRSKPKFGAGELPQFRSRLPQARGDEKAA